MLPEKSYLPIPYYFSDYQILDDSSIAPVNYSMLSCLPTKSKELLSKVITDRVSFLKNTVDELNDMIAERATLTETLKSDIDENMCQARSELYGLELTDTKRNSLDKLIMDLYKDKRQQEHSHWQDAVELKQELRKAQKELRIAMLDLWMIQFLS